MASSNIAIVVTPGMLGNNPIVGIIETKKEKLLNKPEGFAYTDDLLNANTEAKERANHKEQEMKTLIAHLGIGHMCQLQAGKVEAE